ncbi:MAG: hypothetical protein R3230_01840 [Nitrosopumilaceae archaeon]|nr:hypothetical protein [Nitrosopumilaceae archaeon]
MTSGNFLALGQTYDVPLIQKSRLRGMQQKYADFLDNVYDKFQDLQKIPPTDTFDFFRLSLEELTNKGYFNFENSSKKPLKRISLLIENYAKKNKTPLLATFETQAKFKFAEDRYIDLMKEIPKVWVIADFNNPFLAQEFPPNAQTISCSGTNISTIWAVITKGPAGPMGLVAEELVDGTYKGFFSVSPKIVQEVIDQINTILRRDIDVTKVPE